MRAHELYENSPESFMNSKIPNEYVNFKGLSVYLRKGLYFIDGEKKNALQIANVTNPRRGDNVHIDPSREKTRTGKFLALMTELEKLAKIYEYDGVYVESVLNKFLPEVLERYGYSLANKHANTINYWKEVS